MRRHYTDYSPARNQAEVEAYIERLKLEPISRVEQLTHSADPVQREAARRLMGRLYKAWDKITARLIGDKR